MSKHSLSRATTGPLWGRLRVIGSVVAVVAFVALFVLGATGRIGGSSGPDHDAGRVAAEASTGDLPAPSPTAGTSAGGDPTTDPTPEGVGHQKVQQGQELKHTLAWLRRGLADATTFR